MMTTSDQPLSFYHQPPLMTLPSLLWTQYVHCTEYIIHVHVANGWYMYLEIFLNIRVHEMGGTS